MITHSKQFIEKSHTFDNETKFVLHSEISTLTTQLEESKEREKVLRGMVASFYNELQHIDSSIKETVDEYIERVLSETLSTGNNTK